MYCDCLVNFHSTGALMACLFLICFCELDYTLSGFVQLVCARGAIVREEAASQQVKSKPSRNEPGGPFHWECGRIASHFKRGSILSKAQNTGTSRYAAKTKTRNGSESPWRPTLFITNSGICYYYQQSRITRVMCITKTGQKPTIAERTSFRLFQ